MKKVIFYLSLLVVLLLAIAKYDDYLGRTLEVASRFSAELPLGEIVSDSHRGLQQVSKLTYSAVESFYEGFIVDEESTTSDGDTIILRHQKNTRTPTVNISWDSASMAIRLQEKGIALSDGYKSQLAYVTKFKEYAVTEMLKHGIPASIKLAQGILESSSGKSKLCRESNNHFGVKCRQNDKNNRYDWSPREGASHCVPFSDDVPWDQFCAYSSAEKSYITQSKVLMNKRYAKIFAYPISDKPYKLDKDWYGMENVPYYAAVAAMLKEGGYATSPTYHYKISDIINVLELWRIDFDVIRARAG